MPTSFSWIIGLLLAAGSAAAQTSLLRPAQTITLGPHATVGGTVVLPNHNTVLLLTDAESPDIVAQCLAPDGHILWKTTATRYGRAGFGTGYYLDARQIAIGQAARADKQLQKEKDLARLYPVSVLTNGNEVVLVETISEETINAQGRGYEGPLQRGQKHVQRLDEQGQLTKHLFSAPPAPESRRTYPFHMAHYADADGYTQVVCERNVRENMTAYALYHFSLKTNDIRRELIDLPAVPPQSREYRNWFMDWAYLGHRPGQLYFGRRSLKGDTKVRQGRGPLLYQVYLTDEHGLTAPGGFSAEIALPPDTRVAYSGHVNNTGEVSHVPNYVTISNGKRAESFDCWDISTGGMGDFHLDYATGEVLLVGEYTDDEQRPFGQDHLVGIFARRYAPDGRLLAQSQTAYSAPMLADKEKLSFKTNLKREVHFFADPVTGRYQYSFSPTNHFGSLEDFDLFLDHDLRWYRYDYFSSKDKAGRVFTSVVFAQPFDQPWGADARRRYEHADKTDLPLYAALEHQRRAAGPATPDHCFYLSSTGPGTGLVVEKSLGIGGALRIYTF